MTLCWAREVGRDFINMHTYFLSFSAVTVPDQLWLGGNWPARGEAGSLWGSASHGGMPHLASLEFGAWREVHTLFRPSGAWGLCCDNLDEKFCCSKGSLHHLVLERPRVLFPKCWMVAVHMHVLPTCLASFNMDKVLQSVVLSGLCTS